MSDKTSNLVADARLAVEMREEAEFHKIVGDGSGEYFRSGELLRSGADAIERLQSSGETTREPRSSHERLVPPAGVDVFGEREWWMATAQRLQRQLALSEELEQAMADCIGVEDGQTFEQRAEELVVTEVAYQNKHGATAILSERPSYGPGMTEHSSDCRCYACTAKQFCPHCGKSEPHTHRVPGSAEPVIFPHGSPVKTPCKPLASTDDGASRSRTSSSSVECPKCRTQLAFEGDVCGLCE